MDVLILFLETFISEGSDVITNTVRSGLFRISTVIEIE
jgi:hypothetical protein